MDQGDSGSVTKGQKRDHDEVGITSDEASNPGGGRQPRGAPGNRGGDQVKRTRAPANHSQSSQRQRPSNIKSKKHKMADAIEVDLEETVDTAEVMWTTKLVIDETPDVRSDPEEQERQPAVTTPPGGLMKASGTDNGNRTRLPEGSNGRETRRFSTDSDGEEGRWIQGGTRPRLVDERRRRKERQCHYCSPTTIERQTD